MNIKQILIVVLFIMITFTILIGGIMALVVYNPEAIGFGNKPKPVKVNMMKKGTSAHKIVKNKPKVQSEKEKTLADSIRKVNTDITNSKVALAKTRDTLGWLKSRINSLQDSLNKIAMLHDKAGKDLESLKAKLASSKLPAGNLKLLRDSLKTDNYKKFSGIYENADPKAIARIIEKIDPRDAASILKMMQKKKAGKVLESINPDQAAAILASGSLK